MTEVYRRMLSDEDEDTPAKCRQRRRRRIEMRRHAAVSASGALRSLGQTGDPAESSDCGREGKRLHALEAGDLLVTNSTQSSSGEEESMAGKSRAELSNGPVYGTMSISGRSREMEDAISVRTELCRPDINHRRPVHFFAVYDGHGGPHVAALCKEKMHVFLEEELMRVGYTRERKRGRDGSSQAAVAEECEKRWRSAMKRSFERMDAVATNTCACGSVGHHCGCHSMEVALGGSTAVVALLTPEHIVVANCGDSRAVLYRGGKAIPLSFDHKPDRSDELARIEAAGGRVIFVNGARVEGILAMSRAIGDKYLKPVVSSEPEITFTKRQPEDECLILASDGLWDVLSSDLACEVAHECLKEGNNGVFNAGRSNQKDEGSEALYPSCSVLAAALLTRLALGRKSLDNISVIVVDLKKS